MPSDDFRLSTLNTGGEILPLIICSAGCNSRNHGTEPTVVRAKAANPPSSSPSGPLNVA